MKINRTFLRSTNIGKIVNDLVVNCMAVETTSYEYTKTSSEYIIQLEFNEAHLPLRDINKINCITSMGIQASQWWFEEETQLRRLL